MPFTTEDEEKYNAQQSPRGKPWARILTTMFLVILFMGAILAILYVANPGGWVR